MRVLFDQATPVPIRDYLNQPVVSPASAEAAGFDVFLTTDKNLRYQQKLVGRKIAIVVLGVQQWPQLRPHMQRVIDAVNAALPDIYIEI